MTAKERKELTVNMIILTQSVINRNLNSEEVANTAVSFVIDVLKSFPELRESVDSYLNSEDSEWDRLIDWINFEKENLR